MIGDEIKYTDHGHVAISVSSRDYQESEDVLVLFDVEDSGIGIAPEDQARIFDPFFQASAGAVTASASAPEREEILAAKLDDYLRKPYRPGEIFSCMARHLGVGYVWPRPQVSVSPPTLALQPSNISCLPSVLRAELKAAVISLDPCESALLSIGSWISTLKSEACSPGYWQDRIHADPAGSGTGRKQPS